MEQYTRNKDQNPIFGLLGKPNYYDSPEGQNPWEKIWGLGKYALPTAIFLSSQDMLYHSQTRNIVEATNCFGFWLVPLVGLSTTFASVTCIVTNLRGKDDKFNYACGVLACSPILYAWRKSASFTWWGTAILMAAALIKKDSVQNGWEINPKLQPEYGNYTYDFTLTSTEWPKRPL